MNNYTRKPQIRAICIYKEYTKVISDHWDIRPLVTIGFIIILGIARQIYII